MRLETSLLYPESANRIEIVKRVYLLDDNVDLDALLRLPLEKLIEAIVLLPRSSQIDLRRDPPVVDVYSFFRQEDCATEIPEIIALLERVVKICLDGGNEGLTPSTSHWAATFNLIGAKLPNRFVPAQCDAAAVRSSAVIHCCICL